MYEDDQRAHLERIMRWWRLRGALPLNPERRLCERAPPPCTTVAAAATCIAAATTSSDNLRRRQRRRRRRRRSLNYQQHSHARTHARTRLHGGRIVVVL